MTSLTESMLEEKFEARNYVDILEDRRRDGDLFWVTRKWECPKYRFAETKTPKQIAENVLKDSRVQMMISRLSVERGVNRDDVIKEADAIIEEMNHNYQLKAIRFFGYILAKAAKRLYEHIYVNRDGIDNVRKVADKYPILFMPTHRSYADFLLVSYICFHFNIPVPVIAAGLDFLGLKAVSMLLRNSGAFFIRRQFSDDKLYWTIFTVYVQMHVLGGDAPIEFFVEGTRSRTAKSLLPKLGLLQVALELYFTARVPDITVIPISISYDRTLEEILYSYELLGVPKPKESTKGLFKARKILQQNFGNVYVQFGNPISVRDFCNGKIDRSIHNLQPRFLSSLNEEEQLLCLNFANHIIKRQQHNLLLSPFPLICLVVGYIDNNQKVYLNDLFSNVGWLTKLLNKTGISIVYENTSLNESIIYHINLHSNLLKLSDGYVEVISQVNDSRNDYETLRISVDMMKLAIPQMMIYHYSNQVLQLLVHFSMISLTLNNNVSLALDVVFNKYKILMKLLSKEFVFEQNIVDEFKMHLQIMQEEEILLVEDSKISVVNQNKIKALASLLVPLLQTFAILCEQFLNGRVKGGTNKDIIHQVQRAIEILLQKKEINDYKSLSVNTITNCITCLAHSNAIQKEKKDGKITFKPILSEVATILYDIESFLPDQMSKTIYRNGSIQSKL
ncbi:dihydroxyacetone phosphate acyltransferase-like [Centruroides sculpturatus]|uniref:dihydroxyacetone phosphate acyltransferase-like n=1 Tax=Centruroides sculpturatus TaxID=218467 RepID=UPI000C6DB251|nr:dihydroxyacetone phosphate acyltransferase-like [Centruroides sculpturatus]XP_023228674.1 dihydroxyacetone phosphate acyltransferase-like [Centruroides sculpturatus]